VKKRVVIGLSGGVDSSVAAWVLKDQGYEVTGLFMKNWHDTTGLLQSDCHWEDDLMFAEMVAKKLGIPFHVVDLSVPYRQRVVDYMFSEYEKGRTPNPDVLCNREIKFDSFAEEARKLGGDFVATGHYCRKETISVNFSMSMVEYAWTNINNNAKIIKIRPQDKDRFHPTQKPKALYKFCYDYAKLKPGAKIFDSHLGSGNSRIVAYKMGFNFYGTEIDKDYFNDSCKAFDREIKGIIQEKGKTITQGKLF